MNTCPIIFKFMIYIKIDIFINNQNIPKASGGHSPPRKKRKKKCIHRDLEEPVFLSSSTAHTKGHKEIDLQELPHFPEEAHISTDAEYTS